MVVELKNKPREGGENRIPRLSQQSERMVQSVNMIYCQEKKCTATTCIAYRYGLLELKHILCISGLLIYIHIDSFRNLA